MPSCRRSISPTRVLPSLVVMREAENDGDKRNVTYKAIVTPVCVNLTIWRIHVSQWPFKTLQRVPIASLRGREGDMLFEPKIRITLSRLNGGPSPRRKLCRGCGKERDGVFSSYSAAAGLQTGWRMSDPVG